MEQKLKTFGELLKETLGGRTDLSQEVVGDDTTLSDADRNAILEKVASQKKETPAQSPSVGASSEDDTLVPFGVLLERTIALQENLKKEEVSEKDDIREEVIKRSNLKLGEDLMKRLIR
jgi:hypothetical protein